MTRAINTDWRHRKGEQRRKVRASACKLAYEILGQARLREAAGEKFDEREIEELQIAARLASRYQPDGRPRAKKEPVEAVVRTEEFDLQIELTEFDPPLETEFEKYLGFALTEFELVEFEEFNPPSGEEGAGV